MAIHYSIDSLTIRNGRLFGWGWFLDTVAPVESCTFVLTTKGGGFQSIACIFSGMRTDLQAAHPDVPHAAAAGFMLQSPLDLEPDRSQPAKLEVRLADGRTESWEVSVAALSPETSGLVRLRSRLRTLLGEWRKRANASGEWAGLSHVARTLRARWVNRRQRLPSRLRALRGRRAALVLDHGMGGGANRYRREFVRTSTDSGVAVVVIVPRLASLDYSISVLIPGCAPFECGVDDIAPVLDALSDMPDLHVHVNELISFHDVYAIIAWCIESRGKNASRLVFHAHDYYAACPSWTLIADDGRYCGVPSIQRCRACLPKNSANTMGFTRENDLVEWRERWGRFIAACDEIVAFSSASVDILRLAHPGFPVDRVHIRPHRVDASAMRPVVPARGEVVVVAVAGHISRPKGADMLREMAEFIRHGSLPVRIVVIGTLEGHRQSDHIDVLGEFETRALPDLLERVGASICFLPSVCAETYSFVTDEYMAMRMPVAVFPIGAPAERVARYADGLVLSRVDAQTAVCEILDFVRRSREP